jgi:hypothetical protein
MGILHKKAWNGPVYRKNRQGLQRRAGHAIGYSNLLSGRSEDA